jgi:hypothetical protein
MVVACKGTVVLLVKFKLRMYNCTVFVELQSWIDHVTWSITAWESLPSLCPSMCRTPCAPGQIHPILGTHQHEVCIQGCQLVAVSHQFPSGVPKTPPYFKFHTTTLPSVGRDLLYEPFGVIWGAEVIWVRVVSVGKQNIVIRVVRPQQAHMEPVPNLSTH